MEKPELRLKGNQRKLMKWLREGPANKILPKFVNETLRGIIKQSEEQIKEEIGKVKIELEKCMKEIRKQFKIIERLGGKK